jgi:glycosyltransferase involved in cell wall biosynthesis
MVDSIHAARWARQFDPNEVEFTLFPSGPNRRVHAIFKERELPIVPFGGLLSIPLWAADRIFDDRIRGLLLRRAIKRIKPDFIHALELQHAGYVTARALEDKKLDTAFIATNYGSDIFWFQKFPKHLAKIKKVLARANRYSAECFRDIDLARKYGFQEQGLPVFPNAGGFTDVQLHRELLPPSQRKFIAIKGYEGWVGRASVSIEALYSLTSELAEFKIVFYSCNHSTIRLLKKAKKETSLNIAWHAKGALSHAQMMELLASSRVYVGLSLSDGISTSLLEAMSQGAFPIQTSTSCCNEWFDSGVGGFSVDDISPLEVTSKLAIALTDDALVDAAAKVNISKVRIDVNASKISQVAKVFYDL